MRGLCQRGPRPLRGSPERPLNLIRRTVSAPTTVADLIGNLAALHHRFARGRVVGVVFAIVSDSCQLQPHRRCPRTINGDRRSRLPQRTDRRTPLHPLVGHCRTSAGRKRGIGSGCRPAHGRRGRGLITHIAHTAHFYLASGARNLRKQPRGCPSGRSSETRRTPYLSAWNCCNSYAVPSSPVLSDLAMAQSPARLNSLSRFLRTHF